MILVDANVLIDLFTDDPSWADWSEAMLAKHASSQEIAINPLIFAEVSVAFSTVAKTDQTIDSLGLLRLELPYPAASWPERPFFDTGVKGAKRSPLPDFYIEAHAQISGLTLPTRDSTRYRSYFPEVMLIAPDSDHPRPTDQG